MSSFCTQAKSSSKTEETREQQKNRPALQTTKDFETRILMEPRLEHNFSRIQVRSDLKEDAFLSHRLPRDDKIDIKTDSCPLALTIPRICPFWGACHTCPMKEEVGKDLEAPAAHSPVAGIIENAKKTECDVKVHPDDILLINIYPGRVRTVGEGEPKIVPLINLSGKPCLDESVTEHEKIHVKNRLANCRAFKKCIDENTSGPGKPTISYKNFVKCHNKHHGGGTGNCEADEKEAYEAGIKKAEQLLKEPRCKLEKDDLKRNVRYWRSIEDNPPNCPKKKEQR